ncbi:MAG: MATE family efflux transporter [Clostridiales bacterium]|nr:MATE family efflux transporter [Candidatus Blautia equi]
MEEKHGLTTGSVPKRMLLFALPVFLSNLFQQLYNTVDSLIVGNYLGSEALAAVGSSGSLIFLMTGFVTGVSMGAGVLIARYFGAKDNKNLHKVVHTTVALAISAGIALTLIGVTCSPTLLRWMGTPQEVMHNSVAYFRVYYLGCSAVVMYNCGASILQSIGDSRSPMVYLITSAVINVILDLVFIAGFHGGVSSAALATVISQAISALLAFRKLTRLGRKGETYGVKWREVRFDRHMLRAVVAQGVPSGIQNSVISIANVVVQANINSFGANAMAGCGSYSKVEGFAFLPVTCFSMALATFVSQNYGAGKPDRVKKGVRFGLVCPLIMAEMIGITVFTLAPFLIGSFSNDPNVIAYGVMDARTISLFYCVLAYDHCVAGIMRGLGRPMVPMAIMLAIWCVFRITYITVALKFINDIRTIFWAYPITWVISSVIFTMYLINALKKLRNTEV